MKIEKLGEIDAGTFINQMEFWDAHIRLIEEFNERYEGLHVVCEDYQLYKNKALAQTNSKMETPRLIGCIQLYCYMNEVILELEPASAVKTRWSEKILVRKGYLQERGEGYTINERYVSNHIRDSIKHAVHYATFKIEKKSSF